MALRARKIFSQIVNIRLISSWFISTCRKTDLLIWRKLRALQKNVWQQTLASLSNDDGDPVDKD